MSGKELSVQFIKQNFEAANKERLGYIAANRIGKLLDEENDIVIGPVANDQTVRTERTLKLLEFVEAKNV